ncbi:MAG: glycogen/starch synthase, partial [Candidatus Omnitrophota bacterium]
MKRFLILVLTVVFSSSNILPSYALRPQAGSYQITPLDVIASTAKQGEAIWPVDNADKSASAGISVKDAPADYFIPKLTKQQKREALYHVGSIFDGAMEAIEPEFKDEATQGSKGGLGILEGDTGEGLKKAVLDMEVAGSQAFMFSPMYEYKLVPVTDIANKRQVLLKKKVKFENKIDFDNPISYKFFTKRNRFKYPELEKNGSRPLKIVADDNGEQLKFNIKMYDSRLGCERDFIAAVFVKLRGGTPMFKIACQEVDDILYTDDEELRFEQQVLMGKAIKLLIKKLEIKPGVFRVNEAHTVVAMAEMICDESGYFDNTAYVFTNHTPITPGLQIYHGKAYWFDRLGIPAYFKSKTRNVEVNFKDIFVRGDDLNFSYAAMYLAHKVNGVSKKHAEVLKEMFPEFAYKITGIMNGSSEYWVSDRIKQAEKDYSKITPLKLWEIHQQDKLDLIELVEQRTGKHLKVNEHIVGCVRRIDYYKQQYPMLKDIIRAICQDKGVKTKVLIDGQEHELEGLGMQVVLGGIIVNQDNPDLQWWIHEFISWMEDPEFKGRFVFISGNDVELMKKLAIGCDSWIEMPKPPNEACGTSGMRVVENGNIEIGSPDGWILEFIRRYNMKTGKGNGFIIQGNNQIGLYNELKDVSHLYYDWMEGRDQAWIKLRKKIYEEGKHLYIKNMVWRYILEVFLPARLIMQMGGVKWVNNLKPEFEDGKVVKTFVGDSLPISADIGLYDISLAKHLKAELWTNIGGVWKAIPIRNKKRIGEDTYRFLINLDLKREENFQYKVRFFFEEPLAGRSDYLYLPEGYGKDFSVNVKEKECVTQNKDIAGNDIIRVLREKFDCISMQDECLQKVYYGNLRGSDDKPFGFRIQTKENRVRVELADNSGIRAFFMKYYGIIRGGSETRLPMVLNLLFEHCGNKDIPEGEILAYLIWLLSKDKIFEPVVARLME